METLNARVPLRGDLALAWTLNSAGEKTETAEGPGHPPLTQGGRGRVHPRVLILAGNLLEAQAKIVGEDEGSLWVGRLRYEGCISLPFHL